MIVGKTRKVPASHTVERNYFCDGCGESLEKGNRGYDVDEVTIQHKHGERYPESDDTQTTWVDVCGSCFTTKVQPALETLGFKFRERDTEKWSYVDKMETENADAK